MKLIKLGLLVVSFGCCIACTADIDVKAEEVNVGTTATPVPEATESSDAGTTTTDQTAQAAGNAAPAAPVVSPIPDSVKESFSSKCDSRPTATHMVGSVDGVSFDYTEVLSEEDVGSSDVAGLKLVALNTSGILYVEPSPDGKVHWAARKWTSAESKEKADEAMKALKVEGKPDGDWATVIVDHPAAQLPGARYQVCLVIKAPATWIHDLRQRSGVIESVDHEGVLFTENQSGVTLINAKGAAEINSLTQSGLVDIIQQGSGPVSVESGSGMVTLSQLGSGALIVVNQSGTVNIEADSRSPFDVRSSSGRVNYVLFNGEVPLQGDSSITTESGSVMLEIRSGIGFHLDAEVQSGSLSLPLTYPAPEVLEMGGEKAIVDINGGGKLLKLRTTSGSVSIRE